VTIKKQQGIFHLIRFFIFLSEVMVITLEMHISFHCRFSCGGANKHGYNWDAIGRMINQLSARPFTSSSSISSSKYTAFNFVAL